MQDKMENDINNYQNRQKTSSTAQATKKEGDYIDFEEVKK